MGNSRAETNRGRHQISHTDLADYRPPYAPNAFTPARGGGRAAPAPPTAGRGPAPGRAAQGPDYRQQILSRGWGYALLNTGSVQADNGAGLTLGIIGLSNKGQPRGLDGWGVLRAWAWGASHGCVHAPDLAGHSDIRTTRRYVHPQQEHTLKAMARARKL